MCADHDSPYTCCILPKLVYSAFFIIPACRVLLTIQIYSFLGDVYKGRDGAPAMAIFKFFQSIFACIAFLYNGHMNLMWQLLILVS